MKQIFSRRQGPDKVIRSITLLVIALLLSELFFNAQAKAQLYFEKTAPSKFRIEFTDKENSGFSILEPEKFLSPSAVERRKKYDIPVDETDLPVNPGYVQILQEQGARILNVSKWFNSVTIEVIDTSILENIASLPFVKKHIAGLKSTRSRKPGHIENTMEIIRYDELSYGPSWLQTAVHNGHLLHQNGYTGNGITIAILDAGFSNADTLSVFNRLFENGKVLGTRDFVEPGDDVYRKATHGMSVLSIIGGYRPEGLIGTAPDASFLLLRSEDGRSEYIIEEDNWVAAAEFADSSGADIINTSLGYSIFNDSTQNHTYDDMDGNTARVTRAADLAVSKGMIVIASAGNQGNVQWRHITAPADGDSVLTVGAVDRGGLLASFSSRGPASDGQIKPDIVSTGQGVYVANTDGGIRPGNGTSYSAPVITGLTACLLQANPEMKPTDIMEAIRESADRYYNPDNDYGYGLPDFNIAYALLMAKREDFQMANDVASFPNPFYNQLYFFFKKPQNSAINIRLFDLAGKEVYNNTYPEVIERKYLVIDNDLERLQKGVYIVRLESGDIAGNFKLIKY